MCPNNTQQLLLKYMGYISKYLKTNLEHGTCNHIHFTISNHLEEIIFYTLQYPLTMENQKINYLFGGVNYILMSWFV